MTTGIGVLVAERIAAALAQDHKLVSAVHAYPDDPLVTDALLGMPAEVIVAKVVDAVRPLIKEGNPDTIGVGFPGIIRNGAIEDSPNLAQLKGQQMQTLLETALRPIAPQLSVSIFNDADSVAAGMAAKRGQLDRLIRVWTLGNGIGYGRYPSLEGVWEGGHICRLSRPQRTILRLRRTRPPGRHYGRTLHAPSFYGSRAGRGIRARHTRRTAMCGVRQILAPRSGGCYGQQYSSRRPWKVLYYRTELAIPERRSAGRVSS